MVTIMLTTLETEQYQTIFDNWINGNTKEAARLVKRLTKLKLCRILTRAHEAIPDLIGNPNMVYTFEDFIELALEGIYDQH